MVTNWWIFFRPYSKTNCLNHNIQSLRNPSSLKHLTAIVLLLLTLLCPLDAIPLVKFNRWVSDDIIRRGYNGLSSFPYKASKPPYRTFPPYSLIDPFHSYFALPLHKNANPLQQEFGNVEPIQRSILSNTELVKVGSVLYEYITSLI